MDGEANDIFGTILPTELVDAVCPFLERNIVFFRHDQSRINPLEYQEVGNHFPEYPVGFILAEIERIVDEIERGGRGALSGRINTVATFYAYDHIIFS